LGLLRLAKKYSEVRLENAARRCRKVDKASYSMIKRILIHKLDMESEQQELFNMPEHDNIRGPEAYQ
jgi:hypothetical protein